MLGKKDIHHQLQHALSTGWDPTSRTAWIFGPITDEVARNFIIGLKILDKNPTKPIFVEICSHGGEEGPGYAIYDAMKLAKSEIIAIGYGAVQSIAALILQAADVRLLAPEVRFMVHNGSITVTPDLNSETFAAIGEEVRKNNQKYHRLLAEHSGLPLKEVAKMCKCETYMSAEETIAKGFADAIITER